jgi:hypothetical protein
MPAAVETMMYAGATPGHGLGVHVEGDDVYDIGRCIVHAGLDWEAKLEPIFLRDGRYVGVQSLPAGKRLGKKPAWALLAA